MHVAKNYREDSVITNAVSTLLPAMFNNMLFLDPDSAWQQQHIRLCVSHSIFQCVFSAELLDWMGRVGSLFDHGLWWCRHSGPPEEVCELPAHASAVGSSLSGAPLRKEGVLHPSLHRWNLPFNLCSCDEMRGCLVQVQKVNRPWILSLASEKCIKM